MQSLVLAVNPTDPFFTRLWDFIGVLHPAVVHFPVCCLVLAAVFIAVRWRFPQVSTDVTYYTLLIGAGFAVVATVMGFSFAAQKGFVLWWDTSSSKDETMSFHRWGGVIVTLLSLIAAGLAWRERSLPPSHGAKPWQLTTFVAAAIVALTGHWGGETVYGKGYAEKAIAGLFGYGDFPSRTPIGPAPLVLPPAATPPVSAADPVDFIKSVQPIFEKHCISCHGPTKKKGKLQLHTEELAGKGGDKGDILVPGDSKHSTLFELLTTPEEEDLMPPSDKGGPLAAADIETIRLWIDQGAHWPKGIVLQESK
jgi:uncharacterized membrane protein